MGLFSAHVDPDRSRTRSRLPRLLIMLGAVLLGSHLLYAFRPARFDAALDAASRYRPSALMAHAPARNGKHGSPSATKYQAANPDPPYSAIPRKIWRPARLVQNKSLLKHFNPHFRTTAVVNDEMGSWATMASAWRYETLTPAAAETFVREAVAPAHPELAAVFLALRDERLRVGLLRYLVLLTEGGGWFDDGAEAVKPIEEWMEANSKVAMVVGVELYDSDEEDTMQSLNHGFEHTLNEPAMPAISAVSQAATDDGGSKKSATLCTWAILAAPDHPAIEAAAQAVAERVRDLAKSKSVGLGSLRSSGAEVKSTTGEAIFTETVLERLSKGGVFLTPGNLSRLAQPTLMGDIMILPRGRLGATASEMLDTVLAVKVENNAATAEEFGTHRDDMALRYAAETSNQLSEKVGSVGRSFGVGGIPRWTNDKIGARTDATIFKIASSTECRDCQTLHSRQRQTSDEELVSVESSASMILR